MLKRLLLLVPLAGLLLAGGLIAAKDDDQVDKSETKAGASSETERAIFAGGCFWCMEHPFESLAGVISVKSGYTAGETVNPSYKEVSAGRTGHTEAVEIVFDSAVISYFELLEVFWQQIDPTDAGGQFVDRGSQYRSGIYYLNEEQRLLAEDSRQKLEASGRFSAPIVTEIEPAETFYPAEEYHQDYYKKNPLRYKYYRYGSGRDRFLDKAWGDEREGS